MNNVKTLSFTLIELLIVVSIIGILAAIAIPNYMNASIKAEIVSTYARIKNTHSAISGYMLDHQMFPPHGLGTFNMPVAFSALTTPVNYLGSLDVCEDTLRQYTFDPNHLGERVITKSYFEYDSELVYYHYRSRNINHYHFGKDNQAYDEGIRYQLRSTGPDGWSLGIFIVNSMNLPYNMHLAYSSTNGLRSDGDIISTNVKTYQ